MSGYVTVHTQPERIPNRSLNRFGPVAVQTSTGTQPDPEQGRLRCGSDSNWNLTGFPTGVPTTLVALRFRPQPGPNRDPHRFRLLLGSNENPNGNPRCDWLLLVRGSSPK